MLTTALRYHSLEDFKVITSKRERFFFQVYSLELLTFGRISVLYERELKCG